MANVCTFLLLITHISFQLNSPWPRVVLLHWSKWTARAQSGKLMAMASMVMVMNTDPGLLRRAQTRCKLVLSAATWAATKRGLGLVARRCVFRKCPSLSQRKCLYLDRRSQQSVFHLHSGSKVWRVFAREVPIIGSYSCVVPSRGCC